ncbi:MAG: hypothetical protein ABIK89_15135 [Planctomycetota bacterium]
MSSPVSPADSATQGGFLVPGTCFAIHPRATPRAEPGEGSVARDATLRGLYLSSALAEIPRLFGAVDRNSYRSTYGCLDRQYWHYRTSSFPSEMYQEGVLPLALVYATELPANRWYGNARVRELAVAGIRFAARTSHADGSCDDYYPFERALGAAVFSLQATARAYQLLALDDPDLVAWFRRRADWLVEHDESGRLSNHQALAALGLLRVAQITGSGRYREAAETRVERLLAWQSEEGWFEEYGGADPGYQTVTIDCLAKIRRITGEGHLDEPLRRAVEFARLFLHPNHSYAGEYGSRGTYHFYPHGMELLAAGSGPAADLADGFLMSFRSGNHAYFSDDRMFAHRLGNLIEAYLDWSPARPAHCPSGDAEPIRYLRHAGLLVRRAGRRHTVISAARGGVFKHFGPGKPAVTDAGLIVETVDGRLAVSQWHDPARQVDFLRGEETTVPHGTPQPFSVSGPLHWSRFETVTPLKQAMLYTGMCSAGRFCRTLVRRLLQKRLITGRRDCPIRLTRSFELLPEPEAGHGPSLRVRDTIELVSPKIRIRRMAFGTDHQAAYVAASGVYQEGVLASWVDLAPYVDELNARRQVTVVREI